MNFFGHAHVAARQRLPPLGVLGSMLPDFCGMMRTRIEAVHEPTLAAGVALHHLTDRLFHQLPAFRSQCLAVSGALLREGVGRGPARGVAHVLVELVLDGVLTEDSASAASYLEALTHAQGAVREALLELDAAGEEAWEPFFSRAVSRGLPLAYREPPRVAELIVHLLSPRPLLRLSEDEAARLSGAMPLLHQRITSSAPALLAELFAAFEGAARR